MDPTTVARWQFGITTVYHYFFVPVTIALSLLVAVMQTMWYRSGEEKFLRLTKFYGKLFLINFAMGVVTGIVQEFQFGMNWSEYSRFVGDIFGAPLAFEALLAFFLESTFLGAWIFGWDKLPKKLHLMTIWLAAIGTMLSAIFILAANSFMQNPVGATYNPATDRAEMTDFGALFTNPVFLATFPHTLSAAYLTVGGFILAVAGYHLAKLNRADAAGDDLIADRAVTDTDRVVATETVEPAGRRVATDAPSGSHAVRGTETLTGRRERDIDAYRWAAKFGAWTMLISGAVVMLSGHFQGMIMEQVQPMKMAAAEALYETEGGDGTMAGFSIFTIGTLDGSEPVFEIKIPGVLGILAKNDPYAKVEGINDLQKHYSDLHAAGQLQLPTDGHVNALQQAYAQKLKTVGIDNFVPNIPVSYWTFRIMIGLGLLGMAIGAYALWTLRKGALPRDTGLWRTLMWIAPLAPLFANSVGWIFTEMGRQPWIVAGVLPTSSAVSPGVSGFEVMASMVLYTVIYGALAVVELGLMAKYVAKGLPDVEEPTIKEEDDVLSFAY